jgi:hypothetical protein
MLDMRCRVEIIGRSSGSGIMSVYEMGDWWLGVVTVYMSVRVL